MCGVFGAVVPPGSGTEAATVAALGLFALQHRGQESAGIAATDGEAFHTEKAMGWVADVFHPERLRRLPGHRAIGHVRYSTAGSSNLRNAQPITANTARGPIAIAHNGNLTNADALRKEMEKDGAIFYPKCKANFHKTGCCICSPDSSSRIGKRRAVAGAAMPPAAPEPTMTAS